MTKPGHADGPPPPPPGGEHGRGNNKIPGGGASIDDGIVFLGMMAACYGMKRINNIYRTTRTLKLNKLIE